MGSKCNLTNESLDSLNSSTILQRIAPGEKQAIKECIDRCSNLTWNIALKYTSNRANAEDAVQEIFIDIRKNSSKFEALKSPESAFITLIARRRLIDRLRRRNARPQISFFDSDLLNLPNNDYRKLQKLTGEKPALETLSKLNPKQKQIIALAVFKGMAHSEIARTVGLPLGTVKTNIRRGFNKIRSSVHLTSSKKKPSFY